MIRRYKLGREVELHKRTLEMGLLSVIGPDAPALAGPAEHDNARVTLGGVRRRRGDHRRRRRPLLSRPTDRDAVRAALDFPDGDEADGRDRARRARAPALRRRPRRQRDPAGGRPQRARGLLHQGLLRRARRRSRGCTTAASRTAACSACG